MSDTSRSQIDPRALDDDQWSRAMSFIQSHTMIQAPLLEAPPWIVTGDDKIGYGLHLREYAGTAFPTPPVVPEKVRELQVAFCPRLSDYSSLHAFRQLQRLWLVQLPGLPDFSCLGVMPRLEFFHFGHPDRDYDFSPLRQHSCLKKLAVFGLDGPNDFSFLEGCDALEELHIAGSFSITSLSFLHSHLPGLRTFRASALLRLDETDAFTVLRNRRPEVLVSYYPVKGFLGK